MRSSLLDMAAPRDDVGENTILTGSCARNDLLMTQRTAVDRTRRMDDEHAGGGRSGASGTSAVRVERDGPVTTVILDRPSVRNAVDRETADALAAAFRAFDADADASVAVLWGAGGTFCAGADLKAVGAGEGNRVAPDGDGPMGPTRMALGKPVIAAVAGHAVAGGLELACWCDLRVVEEDAVFGVFCRRWGVPLIDGGTVRLPRLIGMSRALDMILTGRAVGAEEALAFGLANRVVGVGEARAAAERLAAELARFPQVTLRGDRRSAYEGAGEELGDALANEFAIGRESLAQAQRGAARFAAGEGRHGGFDPS
jgi:enoyl-CoA hydratase